MPALQHVGRASRDAVNKYSLLRVPPGGYPSPSLRQDARQDNIYAAYAGAEPSPQVQPHVDFSELLLRIAVAAAGEGGANRVGDVSCQGIRTLAEMHIDSLHQQGCYAMTLFDVFVVRAQWFAEGGRSGDEDHRGQAPGPVAGGRAAGDATPSELHIGEPPHQEVGHGWRLPWPEVGGGGGGEAIPLELEGGGGGGAGGMDDATPSEDDLSKLSQSECQSISTFLTKVLAVAVGSNSTGGIVISAPPFLSLALHKDHQGAGGPTLRPLREAVRQYHMASETSHHAQIQRPEVTRRCFVRTTRM